VLLNETEISKKVSITILQIEALVIIE